MLPITTALRVTSPINARTKFSRPARHPALATIRRRRAIEHPCPAARCECHLGPHAALARRSVSLPKFAYKPAGATGTNPASSPASAPTAGSSAGATPLAPSAGAPKGCATHPPPPLTYWSSLLAAGRANRPSAIASRGRLGPSICNSAAPASSGKAACGAASPQRLDAELPA